MKVTRRNGTLVDFNLDKIEGAIKAAACSLGKAIKEDIRSVLLSRIADTCEDHFRSNERLTIKDIEEIVIFYLMDSDETKEIAQAYIIDKYEKTVNRRARFKRTSIFNPDFISKYKHQPTKMSPLGNFIYLRTYSRFLPEQRRREQWWETAKRAVEYNCSLGPITNDEAEELFDLVFNQQVFLSGRTYWIGGTDITKYYPTANFNCAFKIFDNFKDIKELFYLLMIGTGVGIRILKTDVGKLPEVRTDIKIVHSGYEPVQVEMRQEATSLHIDNDVAIITIGDSKEGWAESLDIYFKLLTSHMYRTIHMILFDYNNIRPQGERLKTFGGYASGYKSILTMFSKIHELIQYKNKEGKKVRLETIDCADICNHIGQNVVAGGVRRTSEIILCDPDDESILKAKQELYTLQENRWVLNEKIMHRQMSNNSVFYQTKPSLECLKKHIEQVRFTGEPGWVNAQAARRRKPDFEGVNPCAEILLSDKGLCNLVTTNVLSFVQHDKLARGRLINALTLIARAAYRMTLIKLELNDWNRVQEQEQLIGCSLTGWQDMVNKTHMSKEEQSDLLGLLREVVHTSVTKYAKSIGRNVPLLMTTIKPEGTLSLLPTVSNGIHYSHSPYYIRRVRVSATDPLIKICEDLGYVVLPEVGQSRETCTTKVVEFPVKAPAGRYKKDVSALEQLDNYLMFMESYVDHNCSITIHVKEHEWEKLTEAIYKNWDKIVAISLLPHSDSFYQLAPYEEITREEYQKRLRHLKLITPTMLKKYEDGNPSMLQASDCVNGACPIR